MCYSAEASFGAAAILLPPAAYCLRSSLKADPAASLPLAAIPLFFSAQQCAEGFVWLGLTGDRPSPVRPAALVFLFFAFAFWPFWIAFSAARIERTRRKWLLWALTALGLSWFGIVYAPLLAPVSDILRVDVAHHSIRYDARGLPILRYVRREVLESLYLIAVTLPTFVSTERRLAGLGVLVGLAATVSYLALRETFYSVWCFFAAILSIYLCFVFRERSRPPAAGPVLPTSAPAPVRTA